MSQCTGCDGKGMYFSLFKGDTTCDVCGGNGKAPNVVTFTMDLSEDYFPNMSKEDRAKMFDGYVNKGAVTFRHHGNKLRPQPLPVEESIAGAQTALENVQFMDAHNSLTKAEKAKAQTDAWHSHLESVYRGDWDYLTRGLNFVDPKTHAG